MLIMLPRIVHLPALPLAIPATITIPAVVLPTLPLLPATITIQAVLPALQWAKVLLILSAAETATL